MRAELRLIQDIEKYLLLKMEEEERRTFEERMLASPELKEQVREQELMVAAIQRIGMKSKIQLAERKYKKLRNLKKLAIIGGLLLAGGGAAYGWLSNNESFLPREKEQLEGFVTDSMKTLKSIQMEEEKNEKLLMEDSTNAIMDISTFELPEKKFQYFTINPERDTILTGKEGTRIKIRANSFNSSARNIKIRLKEYYQLADIAFSDLSTETQAGKLLETGGMLLLEAYEGKRKVDLKEGERVSLQFPSSDKGEDMALFLGKEKEGIVKWELADTSQKKELVSAFDEVKPVVFTVVEEMPEFPGGAGALFSHIGKHISYNREYPTNNTAYAQFTVGTNGAISDIELKNVKHDFYKDQIIAMLNKMPRWEPGLQAGIPVNVRYTLPIRFVGDKDVYAQELEERMIKDEQKRRLDTTNFVSLSYDGNGKYEEKKGRTVKRPDGQGWVKQVDRTTPDSSDNISWFFRGNEENYTTLVSPSFGWINCDRLVSVNGQRIGKYLIHVGDEEVRVRVIFYNNRTILAGFSENGYCGFKNIPADEKICILAIKRKEGKLFFAIKDTTVSTNIPKLKFELATKELYKRYSQKINSIGKVNL